ncbi:MAG: hypothetical protein ABIH66_11225 [bacterium]
MPEFQFERLRRWNLAAVVALAAVGAFMLAAGLYACPLSLGFVLAVWAAGWFYYLRGEWVKPPRPWAGLAASLIWALAYGAGEVFWFQNADSPLYLFKWLAKDPPITFWMLLIMSHFFIVLFASRCYDYSILTTVFYCVNEDASFWLWWGLKHGNAPFPPPINWFEGFPNLFPDWFIRLGEVFPFWPHVPIMYVLIWVLTIPPIILIHLKGGSFFPFRIELGKLAQAEMAGHGATAT